MRVGVFPADLYGCGYYRLIWPAMALKDQGMDVVIIPPSQRSSLFTAEIDHNTDNVISAKVPDFDVIVLQRVTHKYLAQAIPFIRAKGIAVVVDIDDDLETIHPSNPAFTALHPRKTDASRSKEHSWAWARLACESATHTTVTSAALRRKYGRKTPSTIIRNFMPSGALTLEHVDSDWIGWGGGMHSHAQDVPVVGNAIRRLVGEGHNFKVVGPSVGIHRGFGLNDDTQVECTGPTNIDYWHSALSLLGVGIAPLSKSVFNDAKSWLKPLEYASVGVPCVMSPSPEYDNIAALGIGEIARNPKEWYRLLRRLATDVSYRQLRGEVSRATAAELTIDKNAWRWADTWSQAYDDERQAFSPLGVKLSS